MEAPFDTPHELVRPWRRATLIASGVAAIELVLLIAAAAALLAKPLSHAIQRHAESAAVAHPKHAAAPSLRRRPAPYDCAAGGRPGDPARHGCGSWS